VKRLACSGLGEANPFAGEPVERRRPVTGLPGATEIRVTAVISDDEDYIRANLAGHKGLLAHYPKSVRNPDPEQVRLIANSRRLVEQRLCLSEIGRAETFGEPAVDGRENVASLVSPPLGAQQPGETDRAA
jgi:hypothetical protein